MFSPRPEPRSRTYGTLSANMLTFNEFTMDYLAYSQSPSDTFGMYYGIVQFKIPVSAEAATNCFPVEENVHLARKTPVEARNWNAYVRAKGSVVIHGQFSS